MSERPLRSLAFLTGWIFALGAAVLVGWSVFFGGASGFWSRGGDESGLLPLGKLGSGGVAPDSKKASQKKPSLPEKESEYLFKIEHQVNVLMDIGFKDFAKALIDADGDALTKMIAENFSGQEPGTAGELRIENDWLKLVRQQLDSSVKDPPTIDRSAFVKMLMDLRAKFHVTPKVKLSVMGLAPLERGNLDGTWQGTCLMRIWGETEPGQPAEVAMQWRYRIAKPVAKVFAAGGWMQSCIILQRQVGEATHFLLHDVAADVGLHPDKMYDNWKQPEKNGKRYSVTGGVHVCDYDRDGILDMLINDVTGAALYHGTLEGKFIDVSEEMGLAAAIRARPGTRIDRLAVFIDIDDDGWEDLVMEDLVMRNDAGQGFEDYTHKALLNLIPSATNLTVVDYDQDGLMDLYVCVPGTGKADSWVKGKSGRMHGNQLLRNEGNWRFRDVTAHANAIGGFRSTFTAVWMDVNNDGKPDAHVINEFGNGILLVNRGNGTFREHELGSGPLDFGSMGLTCGDFDNDGFIDMYVANMYSKAGNRVIGNLPRDAYDPATMDEIRHLTLGSQLYRNKGGLKFEQMGLKYQVADVGWAYGPAMIDLDNDGFLDIHATAGFMSRKRSKPDG